MILQICAHLYGYTVESFGHKYINQVLCQVVFNAEDHINVVRRNFPLQTHRWMYWFAYDKSWLYLGSAPPVPHDWPLTLLLTLQYERSAMPWSSIRVCLILRGSRRRMSCCSNCPMFTLAEAAEKWSKPHEHVMRQTSHIEYLSQLIFRYFGGCNALGYGDITIGFIYIFEDPHGEALEDLDLPYSHLIIKEESFFFLFFPESFFLTAFGNENSLSEAPGIS